MVPKSTFSLEKCFLTQKGGICSFYDFLWFLRHGETGYTLATPIPVARATFETLSKVDFCYFLVYIRIRVRKNILLGMCSCL